MKKMTVILTVLMSFLFIGNLPAVEQSVDWDAFSLNLVQALKSNSEGLQLSAMQLVVKHGDKVWVNDAAYEIYQVFRYHKNNRIRQLALVTLYKMDNAWFKDVLKEDVKTETSPIIKHQMIAIINENAGKVKI